MAVTLSNVFIFPRGQMFTKTYFLLYSSSQHFQSHYFSTSCSIIYSCFSLLIIVIGFGLWINLMILSLRWTILFAERKFYDANIVLDSFQNRVLKTHLNFTSLSSESRVPSFYAFASTQLPYLIFHSFKKKWKRNIYVCPFLQELKVKMLQWAK